MSAYLSSRREKSVATPKIQQSSSAPPEPDLKKEDDSEDEPLVDTTQSLPLRSKRTDRAQKRRQKKAEKAAARPNLMNIPAELRMAIVEHLKPSEIFCLSATCHSLRDLIGANETSISKQVIRRRYFALAKCFPLPRCLGTVDSRAIPILIDEHRQRALNMHRTPYQHIRSPDCHVVCSCLTCILAWNNLSVVVDLNHWQDHLDRGERLPLIQRNENPQWNDGLLNKHVVIVDRAMYRPLWYAAILQKHLETTVRSIRRHDVARRKQQKPTPFDMSDRDAESETDLFLERKGPPSFEFLWRRFNYDLLETYLPNRRWDKEENRWLYQPDDQHERDIEWFISNPRGRSGIIHSGIIHRSHSK